MAIPARPRLPSKGAASRIGTSDLTTATRIRLVLVDVFTLAGMITTAAFRQGTGHATMPNRTLLAIIERNVRLNRQHASLCLLRLRRDIAAIALASGYRPEPLFGQHTHLRRLHVSGDAQHGV